MNKIKELNDLQKIYQQYLIPMQWKPTQDLSQPSILKNVPTRNSRFSTSEENNLVVLPIYVNDDNCSDNNESD